MSAAQGKPPVRQILEAAIMAADQPLSLDGMMQLFEDDAVTRKDIETALTALQADCAGRGLELKALASGYRFQVKAEYGQWVSRLWRERPAKYSRALLETLALVAYKQPVTRGDIEEVRGVAVSTNIMRTLIEREWVRVVGHREAPGQPALYATTRAFLDYFNLSSLDDLPPLADIQSLTSMNEELDLEEELLEAKVLDLHEDTPDAPDDQEQG